MTTLPSQKNLRAVLTASLILSLYESTPFSHKLHR